MKPINFAPGPCPKELCSEVIRRRRDWRRLRTIYQHGENPEAALLLEDIELCQGDELLIAERLQNWLTACHERLAATQSGMI